jgi:hypothetical protein
MNEYDEYEDLPGSFLAEESDDIDFILMPKLNINIDDVIEEYYKSIKECKNKNQVKEVLRDFYQYVCNINTIMNDIQYLQDRAKQLELDVKFLMGET